MEQRHRERILESLDFLIQNTPNDKFEKLLSMFSLNKGLSPYMLQKINAGNGNERKRKFFEMVPKRGPDAFSKLCNCLYQVGLKNLAEHLRESRLIVSDGPCLSKGFGSHGDKKVLYAIKSQPRGHVLILNIMKFKFHPEKNRTGSEKDVACLKEIWTNLDYNVIIEEDLDFEKFNNAIDQFIHLTRSQKLDSIFVFIMTHGKRNENHYREVELETNDSRFINSESILNKFSSKNSKHIADIPKVIFIQACRGGIPDLGYWVRFDSVVTKNLEYNNNTNNAMSPADPKPHYSNLLLVFSTLPGFVAKRNEESGAPFIQELCRLMNSKAKKSDLLEIIHEVNRNLHEEVIESLKMKERNFFQTVHYENFGFSKQLYL